MNKLIVLALAGAFSLPVFADRYVTPRHAAFEEECGACHLAFPPAMLDANSWRAVMGGLTKHFGSDASLEEPRRLAIAEFLNAHAGGRKVGVTADTAGKPLLRITETARFVRKHREIAPAVFQRTRIKSPANCVACHTRATAGDYEERGIVIPK